MTAKKSMFFPIPHDILLHCTKDILRYSCLTLLHTDGVVGPPIQESAETDVMKGSKREKKKIIKCCEFPPRGARQEKEEKQPWL